MIRDSLKDFKGLDHDPDFRWRGTNVTRIENLSDIIFAIALGMLITGVDAPKDLSGLRVFLLSAIPTAAGFAVLLGLWKTHYTFFRRYGVADAMIVRLNTILIFVVLFMAYPLRFAFDSLFAFIETLITNDYSKSFELGVASYGHAGEIITYFCVMYSAAFALFALMHRHILKKAVLLSLNPFEIAITKQMHLAHWGQCVIALIAAALAWFSPLHPAAAALLGTFGIAYWWAERRFPSKHLMAEYADM